MASGEFIAGMTAQEALSGSEAQGPSLQEQANIDSARSFERTADHLAYRRNTHTVGDSGHHLEAELQQVQAQIAHGEFSNFLEEEKLHARAQALATAIVRGEQVAQVAPSSTQRQADPIETATEKDLYEDTPADTREDISEHLRNELPGIDESLQYAADHMATGAAEALNESLSSGDEAETTLAAQVVSQYHKNPDGFGHSDSVMEESSYYQAKEEFGEELANEVLKLSKGMAKGTMSLNDALKIVGKRPDVLSALISGQQKGLWTINLGL